MEDQTLPHLEKDDERIDEFGRYFLCVVTKKLDSVLESAGIGLNQRLAICSLYCDNLAAFLDAGWIENGEERLWPVLCFAERARDTESSVGDFLRLMIPSSETFLSEGGAEGAIAFHFEHDAEAREWISFRAGLRGDDKVVT